MSKVDRAVGVGKGAGYKNSSFLFAHGVFNAAGFPAIIRIRNYGMTASQAVASAMQIIHGFLSTQIRQSDLGLS